MVIPNNKWTYLLQENEAIQSSSASIRILNPFPSLLNLHSLTSPMLTLIKYPSQTDLFRLRQSGWGRHCWYLNLDFKHNFIKTQAFHKCLVTKVYSNGKGWMLNQEWGIRRFEFRMWQASCPSYLEEMLSLWLNWGQFNKLKLSKSRDSAPIVQLKEDIKCHHSDKVRTIFFDKSFLCKE